MKIIEAYISYSVIDFFEYLKDFSLKNINTKLKSICGINSFFDNQLEIDKLISAISSKKSLVNEPDRSEYGDFQTNKNLSCLCMLKNL